MPITSSFYIGGPTGTTENYDSSIWDLGLFIPPFYETPIVKEKQNRWYCSYCGTWIDEKESIGKCPHCGAGRPKNS